MYTRSLRVAKRIFGVIMNGRHLILLVVEPRLIVDILASENSVFRRKTLHQVIDQRVVLCFLLHNETVAVSFLILLKHHVISLELAVYFVKSV
jgi:small basic protein